MDNSIIRHNIIIYCSLIIMIIVYLYQIYSQPIRVRFILTHYLETVVISILCGAFSYLFLCGCVLILKKYQADKINSTPPDEPVFDIKAIENDFNEITNAVHSVMVKHINLPDFDSDLVDHMQQKVIRLWRVSCMAYAYALLLIHFVTIKPDFMTTEHYDALQNLVLQRMAKFRHKLALEFADETLTNQQLTSETIEIISGITDIINHRNCQHQTDENLLLEALNDYLQADFNYDKTNFSTDIKEHAIGLLKKLRARVGCI